MAIRVNDNNTKAFLHVKTKLDIVTYIIDHSYNNKVYNILTKMIFHKYK